MNSIPNRKELAVFFNKNHHIFSLPIEISDGDKCKTELNKRWDAFLALALNTPWMECLADVIRDSIKYANEVFESYFDAKYVEAIEAIARLVKIAADTKVSYAITSLRGLFIDEEYNEWFRGRTTGQFPLSVEEMGHIPFNQRAHIGNQRYSINGIPCLYLGNSIYDCWEELGRPSIDALNVSRFALKPDKDLQILNLSVTAGDILTKNAINESLFPYNANVLSFFSLWVLQSACSVLVADERPIFREEYVFPQLLMNILNKSGLDGILYFSVRVKNIYYTNHSWICKNLVVPATDASATRDRHSEKIRRIFAPSKPLNLGLWRSGLLGSSPVYYLPKDNWARTHALIQIGSANPTIYDQTSFYRCEIELHRPEYYDVMNENSSKIGGDDNA